MVSSSQEYIAFATGSNSVKGRHCHSNLGSQRIVDYSSFSIPLPDLGASCLAVTLLELRIHSAESPLWAAFSHTHLSVRPYYGPSRFASMVCARKLSPIYFAAVTLTLLWIDPPNATGEVQQNTGTSSFQQDAPYVFRATTREVVVDVIAVDAHDRPVLDLVPSDLHVFEEISHSHRIAEDISSLRVIGPISTNVAKDAPQAGFRIAGNGSCLERASVHYELAYHPGTQGWTSGYHQILIKTDRRGVSLFFRHRYYVGETSPGKASSHKDQGQLEKELVQSACVHPTAPLSVSLRATLIATGNTDVLRYSINIESESLAFVSFSDNGRQLQLDYGACNFDSAGKPLNYMEASTDQVLTSVEYARVLTHGFHRFFEFPVPKGLAMTRFVVRDRQTGNLGSVEILSPRPQEQQRKAPDDSQQDAAFLKIQRCRARDSRKRTSRQTCRRMARSALSVRSCRTRAHCAGTFTSFPPTPSNSQTIGLSIPSIQFTQIIGCLVAGLYSNGRHSRCDKTD